MNIGILGAGGIAGTVSRTLEQMKEINCCAVASRDLAKAENSRRSMATRARTEAMKRCFPIPRWSWCI